MASLIFWVDSKSCCIIENHEIKKKIVQKTLFVKYEKIFYECRILAINDDQSWLKSLIVNDDGVITGFTPKREKPDENKKQLKLKKEQLDEQEQRLLRQERMLNRREQHLEQQQQPIQQQLKTNTNQPVTKTAATNEQVDHHQLTNAQSQKILKVPLYNGSNVNVDKFLLRELKTEWQNNPKHVTRLLLIDLVGKEELKTMTRTGKNNRKPIPEVFMIAIEEFLIQNTPNEFRIGKKEFNKCIKLFLSTLRNPKKKIE